MKSRLSHLLLIVAGGVACGADISPPPSLPPPPSPPPPNRAPIAVAGGPYTSEDGTVTFDGTGSSDPDGDPIAFHWAFGDGATSTDKKPTHTYATDGTYDVSLTVTDQPGLSSTPSATKATVLTPGGSAVLVGAGNIASCGTNNDERTAQLIDAIPGTVFTLGDNAFPDGSRDAYESCYAPTWGRFLDRTRATLGNHEYASGNANPSFDYFGDRVGPRGKGYHSYDLGSWHIIVLNDRGTTSLDEEQLAWLAGDLAANTKQCAIAMWHVPLFLSSNTNGWTTNPGHRPLWRLLYDAGVDVVLNAQQHNYERFAPMKPDGTLDPESGIREFNVGTGGESVVDFRVIHPNSEVRSATFGVLKLTLKNNRYDWEFIPVAGSDFSDSGSGTCH